MKETPRNLIANCGLYCGACGIYQGRIKQAAENMRKVVSAYGFDKMAPELAKWEPAFQHYPEYEKVLNGFVSLFGDCPGCIGNGGDPNCALRKCARQKEYVTCTECNEMDDCEKLRQYDYGLKELKRIKDIGLDKWIDEMKRKVDAGYCYLDDRIQQI